MALKVLIVMGSDSDLDQMLPAAEALKELGVPVELTVASAHRSPDRVLEIARAARGRGVGVVLAGAGGAAHLAGVFAANTTLPVVAVPINWGTLGGVDALLSSVQMPGGVPIASVGIGGGRNAGMFAAAILASSDPELAAKLDAFRTRQAAKVAEADARMQAKLAAK
ncbi:MAG TPA: 5-(carboxyamino)imidazole ribonucleotide mutase [Polyangiaceae bacterium]|nr:5-(carboxyamino)imidazole ribonucleotide mutase [Polyangiaceae bacterium]